jgi:uncharacterized protein with von Willebrand factor type A (vWA) domain
MNLYTFVTDLSRVLRKYGLKVGISESIDACEAISLVAGAGVQDLLTAIRVTMVKDPTRYHLIEEAIQEVASGAGGGGDRGESEGQEGEQAGSWRGEAQRGKGQEQERVSTQYVMYSPAEALHKRTLRPLDVTKLRTGRRIIRRMKRRLAVLPGRRSKYSKRGEIEFKRTIRESFKTFGEIVEFKRTLKTLTRARLVALIDISGSMDTYTDWLVRAMYLFSRFTRRVEIFVFSTRLRRVTDYLLVSNLEEIRRRLSEELDLWGSGTRIGYCLKTFLESYGNLVDKTWVVIIVSDGWDTGEPELLRESLEMLRQRVSRIIWLNPHSDKPGFKPLTIGMLTALPYIDILAGTSIMEDYHSFLTFFGKSIKPMKRSSYQARYGVSARPI